MFISSKRFPKTYMLFKLAYFLPYLMSHIIMYHTLHAKMSFFHHCSLLKLRYLNSGNTINLELVRSQTFWVNDLLLYKKGKQKVHTSPINPGGCTKIRNLTILKWLLSCNVIIFLNLFVPLYSVLLNNVFIQI
jgi:hypothetical protein